MSIALKMNIALKVKGISKNLPLAIFSANECGCKNAVQANDCAFYETLEYG